MKVVAAKEAAVGFDDLPAEAVLRIAEKLEVTREIRSLRCSCTHARLCLGPKEWRLLISRRFGASTASDELVRVPEEIMYVLDARLCQYLSGR